MFSIITIGITKYADEAISDINCASIDAKNVYFTLKHVLDNEFSDFSSICLTNIRANDFISLLSGIAKTLSNEDTIILYFSCHAAFDVNDEFMLTFTDEDGTGNGQISSIHLKEILSKHKNDYILFFDCCHSEAALKMANKSSVSSRNNISVIASTEYYKHAKYDFDGSEFTKILCKAIMQIHENAQDITINSIASEIRNLGSTCYTNLAEGKTDIILKKSILLANDYADFSNVFLSKLSNSNRFVREMMWYSLNDIPSKISLEIINKFIINSTQVSESDWLVRRAIGSLISTMKGNSYQILEAKLKMLNADNWMLQTIGLIACRHSVDCDIARAMETIILAENNTMSLVWLADLYLSDSKYANLSVSLQSNLAKTDWGLIQIWDRYLQHYEPNELFKQISKSVTDDVILKQLKTEIYFRTGDSSIFNNNLDKNILETSNSKLVSVLYKGYARGRTIDKSKKWLLSIMYGNWRGKISVNLDEYFNNTKDCTIIKDLELIRNIPSPEKRACLFSYLQYSQNALKKYKKYVEWGITDSHPWVRKEAILAFKNEPEIIKLAFSDVIDRCLFIGTFDLIISASNYIDKSFLINYIEKYNLTQCEKKSLLLSIMNE